MLKEEYRTLYQHTFRRVRLRLVDDLPGIGAAGDLLTPLRKRAGGFVVVTPTGHRCRVHATDVVVAEPEAAHWAA